MIIVRAWEGLGNQLFQYAFARALSLRTNEQVTLDSKRIYSKQYEEGNVHRAFSLDYFNITLECATEDDLRKYNFLEQKNLYQRIAFFLAQNRIWKYCFIEEKKEDFAPDRFKINRNSYIKGWFQNEKYFMQYRDILLKEITLKKEIEIDLKLQRILQNENTVAIHIRRGDYRRLGLALNIDYYKKAIEYISQHEENPYFLVFSDEIKWVKQNMTFPAHTCFMNINGEWKDYEELMLMSYCRHNIISNSTFSWWAAWLNKNENKKVIAPKRWVFIGDKKELDIAPDNWIRV